MVIHAKRERPSLRLPASHVNTSRCCDGEKESEIQQHVGVWVPQRRRWRRHPRLVWPAHGLHARNHLQPQHQHDGQPPERRLQHRSQQRSTVKPKQCGTGVLQRLPGDPQYVDEHLMDRGLDGTGGWQRLCSG